MPKAQTPARHGALPDGTTTVNLRYGISFISEEQAEKNLHRELKDYNIKALAEAGRQIWNETLGRIQVERRNGRMTKPYSTLLSTVPSNALSA